MQQHKLPPQRPPQRKLPQMPPQRPLQRKLPPMPPQRPHQMPPQSSHLIERQQRLLRDLLQRNGLLLNRPRSWHKLQHKLQRLELLPQNLREDQLLMLPRALQLYPEVTW
jgi:hypothetical protein